MKTTALLLLPVVASASGWEFPRLHLRDTSTPIPGAVTVTCPDNNSTYYTSGNGVQLYLECSIDRLGSDISSVTLDTYNKCLDLCASQSNCVSASWVPGSPAYCYTHDNIGNNPLYNSAIWGAVVPNRLPAGSWTGPTANSSSSAIASAGTSTVASSITNSNSRTSSTSLVASSSVTPSVASSSVTPSVASSSATALSCPASDGTTYLTTAGTSYTIQCGIDHTGGDLSNTGASSIEACAAACDSTPSCIAASWLPGVCYMKSTLMTGVANSNVVSIVQTSALKGSGVSSSSTFASTTALVASSSVGVSSSVSSSSAVSSNTASPLSCPGSDGTTYKAANGDVFNVECYKDRSGNDLGSARTSTLDACLETCSTTVGCLAVSWVPGTPGYCYMHSALGTANTNNGIWGASLNQVLTNAAASSGGLTSQALVSVATSMIGSATNSASSTTAAAALPSSSTTASGSGTVCPGSDGTSVTEPNGAVFLIQCYIDHAGNDLPSSSVTSFDQCLLQCSNTVGCMAVSYVGGVNGGMCYPHSLATGTGSSNNNVWGAILSLPGTISSATSSVVQSASLTSSQSTSQASTSTAQSSSSAIQIPSSSLSSPVVSVQASSTPIVVPALSSSSLSSSVVSVQLSSSSIVLSSPSSSSVTPVQASSSPIVVSSSASSSKASSSSIAASSLSSSSIVAQASSSFLSSSTPIQASSSPAISSTLLQASSSPSSTSKASSSSIVASSLSGSSVQASVSSPSLTSTVNSAALASASSASAASLASASSASLASVSSASLASVSSASVASASSASVASASSASVASASSASVASASSASVASASSASVASVASASSASVASASRVQASKTSGCTTVTNTAAASNQMLINPSFEWVDSTCAETIYPWTSTNMVVYNNKLNWLAADGQYYISAYQNSASVQQNSNSTNYGTYTLSFSYRLPTAWKNGYLLVDSCNFYGTWNGNNLFVTKLAYGSATVGNIAFSKYVVSGLAYTPSSNGVLSLGWTCTNNAAVSIDLDQIMMTQTSVLYV